MDVSINDKAALYKAAPRSRVNRPQRLAPAHQILCTDRKLGRSTMNLSSRRRCVSMTPGQAAGELLLRRHDTWASRR
jgi:hypothetical protein